MELTENTSFRPGAEWLDTEGKPIHAHGGSILHDPTSDVYYWYGENKERTVPGSGIWHWGVRAYRSTDLYNWEDLGLIIPPEPDDPESPLHPIQKMDRPHILWDPSNKRFVCWLKIMGADGHTQASTVLIADTITGPWTRITTGLRPLGMNAGDFDLVIDSDTGHGYYYFEKVHTDLVCADLTADHTDVTGTYSTHFHHPGPPFTREAPAYFRRGDTHYLVTSGTTGYFPNASEFASAPDHHGPWTVIGDAHPDDPTRTSFRSQISSVFRHPHKQDLYIALADRWLPQLPEDMPSVFDTVAALARGEQPPTSGPRGPEQEAIIAAGNGENTAIATYVWLPVSFEDGRPVIRWQDEWRIDDHA